MIRSYLPFVVLATLSAPVFANTDDALANLDDAASIVENASGKCRRDVTEDLRDIRRELRDDHAHRAKQDLRKLRRHTDRCPEALDRALGRAIDALDDDDRDDRDDRRDRRDDRRRDEPKRNPAIPYADYPRDCQDSWLLTEITRKRGGAVDQVNAMFSQACTSGQMSDASWPNGQTAAANGAWYYPNGQTARANGAFYYPNGQTASANGAWYYPNGQTAYANSVWYYPNGSNAGSAETLSAWACPKVAAARCAAFKTAMSSNVESWRAFAVVMLANDAR